MKRRRLDLLRGARYVWFFKLTPVGRVLVITILLTALGSVTTRLPIYQLFCGLLALLGVSELMGLILKPSLRIEGQPPALASAGQPVTVMITIQNRSRWRPALDVMLHLFDLAPELTHSDADASIRSLSPGEIGTLPVTLRAARRGIYALPPIRSVSTFPFNLVRLGGASLEPSRLVVLPAYHPLEELEVPVSHRYQPLGVTLTQGIGQSLEFVGNREYVLGEPARRIDSRAWGRVGKPVVKEFHEEYVSRIALVLDTYVPSGRLIRPSTRKLEAAVSLLAAVAAKLNFHEHVIDLFAAGPELHVFRAQAGTTHFENVLEILAGVDPSHRNPFELLSPRVIEELETISTAICVFVDWDETRLEFVQRVQEAGCQLKAILVQDVESTPQGRPEFPIQEDWTLVSPAEIEEGRLLRL